MKMQKDPVGYLANEIQQDALLTEKLNKIQSLLNVIKSNLQAAKNSSKEEQVSKLQAALTESVLRSLTSRCSTRA
jgi:hypothetical protein